MKSFEPFSEKILCECIIHCGHQFHRLSQENYYIHQMRLTPWSLTALILYFHHLQHSGIIVCGAINWAYFFWLHHTHGSFSSVHCNGRSLEAQHWLISSHCKHNFLLFCLFCRTTYSYCICQASPGHSWA